MRGFARISGAGGGANRTDTRRNRADVARHRVGSGANHSLALSDGVLATTALVRAQAAGYSARTRGASRAPDLKAAISWYLGEMMAEAHGRASVGVANIAEKNPAHTRSARAKAERNRSVFDTKGGRGSRRFAMRRTERRAGSKNCSDRARTPL